MNVEALSTIEGLSKIIIPKTDLKADKLSIGGLAEEALVIPVHPVTDMWLTNEATPREADEVLETRLHTIQQLMNKMIFYGEKF